MCSSGGYPTERWVLALEGFATTFEILQTYLPPPTALSFRVPALPEGLETADHFDTYWGELADLDFTQAQGLRCDYPTPIPQAGDYLEVADTLPEPAAGEGYYYVTAVTHMGETRYGRKAEGGQLSGRDPALLPGCVETLPTFSPGTAIAKDTTKERVDAENLP